MVEQKGRFTIVDYKPQSTLIEPIEEEMVKETKANVTLLKKRKRDRSGSKSSASSSEESGREFGEAQYL